MNYFILCVVFFMCFTTVGQSVTINWGELQRKSGSLIQFLPNHPGEFYALRWSGGRMLGHYKLTKHVDLKTESSIKLKLVADGSIANFEGVHVFQNRLFVFLSDKKDGKNNIFYQEYSEDLKPITEAIFLASYPLEKKYKKGWFDVKVSRNGNYLGVVWEIPAKRKMRDRYGFKVLDSELNEVNEGSYPLPFESSLSKIHDHHISNTGDYFLSVTEYDKSKVKRSLRQPEDYKALHIYHISDEGLQDFTLEVDDRRIVAMAMSSDSLNIFTITGIYGDKDRKGVKGVFHQRVDVLTGEVLDLGFQDFDEQFITEGWTDRDLKKAERREVRGKGAPELFSYQMREAVLLEDGSIVGTMEQYYVQIRSSVDARAGQSTNSYYYYYNDIICYKITPEGEFAWVKKIPKYQVSVNDGGPYSSYESFKDQGKLYFVFNDNVKNYDMNGYYLNPEKVQIANYGKRKNAVAIAELDLETGEIERKTFFDRLQTNTLAIPKLFNVNYQTGELLIYSISGHKEKIGVLQFRDKN